MKLTTVMVPTYNEAGNIKNLIESILALNVPGHTLNVLVVDDNSPDGTGNIVQDFAKKDSRVKLMTRTNKRGRGTAGIDGYKEAIKSKPDYVIEMDADFSHDPKYIPALIASCDQGADMTLGSRFVPGGADSDRGPARQVLSQLAGLYVRTLLGLNLKDVTSGFRCFKRTVLENIGLNDMLSTAPSVVLETLYKIHLKGFKIAEVPIVFIDRRVGTSKLDGSRLAECLQMVLKMKYLNLKGQLFKTLHA